MTKTNQSPLSLRLTEQERIRRLKRILKRGPRMTRQERADFLRVQADRLKLNP